MMRRISGRTPASSVLVSSKARPLASTAQAMRASLLASAIRQRVVVQPPLGGFDPGFEPVTFLVLYPDQHSHAAVLFRHSNFSSLSARIKRLVWGEATMVSTDHFRQELLSQLSRSIPTGSAWSASCCDAMQAEMKTGDTLLIERANGARMTVRYLLPRAI
jgi:hypothetical protein